MSEAAIISIRRQPGDLGDNNVCRLPLCARLHGLMSGHHSIYTMPAVCQSPREYEGIVNILANIFEIDKK
jgi:hypothetical protein